MEERRPRRTEESPPHEARRPQPAPREHEPRETEVREPELPSRAFQRPPREERPTRDERPAREVRPPRDERPPTREERPPTPRREERPRPSQPAPSSLGEMFGPKTPDMDVFGLTEEEAKAPRGRESSTPRARDLDESGSVLEYDQAEGSGSDLSLGAAPPRELGAKTDEEQDQDVPRRRRRRRGRGRRGTGESRGADEARGAGASREAASPRHEADIEPAGEEADFDFERDEELDLEAGVGRAPDATRDRPERGQRREREAEPDRYPPSAERAPREPGEERGGRPRRRRGRGPDRERDEAAPKRPAPYGTTDDEPERFGPPRDTRAPAARTTHDVDDEPDDDLHADIDDADEGQSGDVPTHRKIPTWDEAVGILIDANMASRANSPDRGRGRGRGRGR